MGVRREGSLIVGFALETGDAVAKGLAKLERKGLDLIVANDALEQEELLAADRDRTGRQHVWGATATRTWSLAECVNRSDALISDVSGVVSDYLYSGKPFAVTNMSAPPEQFTQSFPLARAGYVLHRDLTGLDRVLDELLVTDPLAELRWNTRSRYLGDFPAESYADVFVSHARRFVSSSRVPAPRTGAADAEPGLQPREAIR